MCFLIPLRDLITAGFRVFILLYRQYCLSHLASTARSAEGRGRRIQYSGIVLVT